MLYHHSWMKKVKREWKHDVDWGDKKSMTFYIRFFFLFLCFIFPLPLTSPFSQPSLNYLTRLDTSYLDGGCPGGPAGLSAGQVSRDRGAVCELWPRDSDPDQRGELYDKDEFGDPTLCCSVAAETGHPQKELQQITGGYYTQLYTTLNTYNFKNCALTC